MAEPKTFTETVREAVTMVITTKKPEEKKEEPIIRVPEESDKKHKDKRGAKKL